MGIILHAHSIKRTCKPVSIPPADSRAIQVKVKPIKTQMLRNKLICKAEF